MPSFTLCFRDGNLLMTKLLLLLAVSLVLAYISEQNTKAITASGQRYSVWSDWAYIGLVVVLTLFAFRIYTWQLLLLGIPGQIIIVLWSKLQYRERK